MSVGYLVYDISKALLQPLVSPLKWYFKRVLQICQYRDAIICPGVRIAGASVLGKNVYLGNNVLLADCRVGRFSYFSAGAQCRNAIVGAFCSIGPDVLIGLGKHPTNFVSTSPVFYAPGSCTFRTKLTDKQSFQEEHASVRIGNDVWIGARATIADGVEIGDGAIIASAAMVVKNVEPYSIVGGVPARVIRMRFEPHQIKQLLALQWWDKPESWLKEHGTKFHDIDRLLESQSEESASILK